MATVPDYYPKPHVSEMNPGVLDYGEELCPTIPISTGLGECLVRAAGPNPDIILRRGLRNGATWTLDTTLNISLFVPPGAGGDAVVVVEKLENNTHQRDYYQCGVGEAPEYAHRLIFGDSATENPDEQWFLTVVNCPALAAMFQENSVIEFSRNMVDRLDRNPGELDCYGLLDGIEEAAMPASDMFETALK